MCKTLCGTLLLLAIFVLFLNFSHATAKTIMGGRENSKGNFIEKNKLNDVYDVFKFLYNKYNDDTYLSNIKNQSFTMHIWEVGEIEMVKTTCKKTESDFHQCHLEREFYTIKRATTKRNLPMRSDTINPVPFLKRISKVTMYYIWLPGRVRCRKFRSNLGKCPFQEQTEELKREIRYFQLYPHYYKQNVNAVRFYCYAE